MNDISRWFINRMWGTGTIASHIKTKEMLMLRREDFPSVFVYWNGPTVIGKNKNTKWKIRNINKALQINLASEIFFGTAMKKHCSLLSDSLVPNIWLRALTVRCHLSPGTKAKKGDHRNKGSYEYFMITTLSAKNNYEVIKISSKWSLFYPKR